MGHLANDIWYEDRQLWLEEMGKTGEDVRKVGGKEYVIVDFQQVFLPDNLQS